MEPPNLYQSPPITEAVIGINFVEGLSDQDLLTLKERLSQHYPNAQPIENVTIGFKIEANGNSMVQEREQIRTYRLGVPDMSELVVLMHQSVIFSQMAPYPGWDYFSGRFVRDWKIVRRALGFKAISRVGVRYINRVDIPAPESQVDYSHFLDIYPKVPSQFGAVNAYGVQAEILMEDMGCTLTLNSAAVPSPLLNFASFVIDLDISKDSDVPQSDEKLFALIDQIRTRKNEVFESCVTNNARELFGHG